MKNIILVMVYIISIKFTKYEAAKILAVFPVPSISHQVVFRPLIQELVKIGHDVTVITPDPAYPRGQAPENLTEIDVHNVSYAHLDTFINTVTGKSNELYTQVKLLFKLFSDSFNDQLQTAEVQNIIRDKSLHFDLLILEACVRPALIFSHIFKVPVIQISSLGALEINNEIIGTPTHPLLYPTIYNQRLYNLTSWEKIKEVFYYYLYKDVIQASEIAENEMLRKHFGSDIPSLGELSNNVDMLFLNLHPIWEGNRPVPPSVIYVGGLHTELNSEKELQKDLKYFLENSTNGVIYMSFGSNVKPSLLILEKIQIFIKVFSELPYDILWKWDSDTIPVLSKNIKIFKWLPQTELLRHPKVKLFITQGGLQSTDEAIAAGVPVIGVPMLCDQWYNVEKYVYHKIGFRIDIPTLNEKQLTNAINTAIEDDSYRHNVAKLRALMLDQPQRPLERAVWWTEHVLRHGGARHLRAPAANMSWSEHLELKLVFVMILLFLVTIALCALIIYSLYNFVVRTLLELYKVITTRNTLIKKKEI